MKNNLNTQQSKLILQKATYSLILGIISIILSFILFLRVGGLDSGSGLVFLLGMIAAGICAILGLTFGIKGLKSTRRKLAIVGIVVCAITILIWMYMFLGWLMVGGLTEL